MSGEQGQRKNVLSEIFGFLKYWITESLIPIVLFVFFILGIVLIYCFITSNIHWFFYNQPHWITSENHPNSLIATITTETVLLLISFYFKSVWDNYQKWKLDH